jgi:hypothetical protein
VCRGLLSKREREREEKEEEEKGEERRGENGDGREITTIRHRE